MSGLESARDHLLALQERFAASRSGEPGWLAALRRAARERFRERGLPEPKLEEWRYTNVAPLAQQHFALPDAPGGPVTRADLEAVAFPVFACSLYVFVDGVYDPALSALGSGSAVRVESLAELLEREPGALEGRLGSLVDCKAHPFAALNTACVSDGAVLRLPRDVDAGEPVHVVFVATGGAQRLRSPRLLVLAEEGSRARVIQDHVSVGAADGFTNAVSEVSLGAGAQVDLVLLQREAPGGFHVSQLSAHQERDSRFGCHTLSLGGRLLRNDAGVLLAGEGAECTLAGLFVGGGDDVLDNHTAIDHAMPHGTSRELYKGILGGAARGVFRGHVLVRPDAQKTNARQSNPNLLLSAGAEVDTKPQLEIFANDVKCSHGSSIGQLREDALFYLRSRGMAEGEARDLLMRGFASEILAGLPVPALAEGLDEVVSAALARAAGREDPS